jgi:hypothetical protein
MGGYQLKVQNWAGFQPSSFEKKLTSKEVTTKEYQPK